MRPKPEYSKAGNGVKNNGDGGTEDEVQIGRAGAAGSATDGGATECVGLKAIGSGVKDGSGTEGGSDADGAELMTGSGVKGGSGADGAEGGSGAGGAEGGKSSSE